MMLSSVTIKDVASHAGVAISTVSRVINGLDRVSEKTRTKVMCAIEELGYQPDITAQSLKAKKSRAIGLVCEDITSPYILQLVRGIEEHARKNNYSVMLCNGNWKQENIIDNFNMLIKRNIDGIIYSTPLLITEPLLGLIKEVQEEKPFVLISEDNLEDGFHRIDLDIRSGMDRVMEYLLRLGHKRISMIAGPENSGTNAQKIDGYREIMEERGLSEYIQYEYSDLSMDQAAAITKRFYQVAPDRIPTAIIGASDLAAIGSLQTVKKLGYRVPEHVSVIGFGGIKYGLFTDPPLSTINVPRYELGERAFTKLMKFIEDPKLMEETPVTTLPVELEIRESTGPAPE